MKTEAEKAKHRNIIDMAVSSSAIGRIFKKRATEKIRKKLYECIDEFFDVQSKEEYCKKHKEFCEWIIKNIMTSRGKEKATKTSKKASWGQAAKMIDITLKVCIYYCKLPSPSASSKIVPWLNGAIDTAILKYLKKKHNPSFLKGISTLAAINKETYDKLQEIIRKQSSNEKITPVKYDDIMWRKLNQKDIMMNC